MEHKDIADLIHIDQIAEQELRAGVRKVENFDETTSQHLDKVTDKRHVEDRYTQHQLEQQRDGNLRPIDGTPVAAEQVRDKNQGNDS